jgi:hypothetical protein
MSIKIVFAWAALSIAIGCAFVLVFSSCGRAAQEPEAHAIAIASPVGVNCFAVISEGKAVGGSCLYVQ